MPNLLDLLGVDRFSKSQRRASALAKADIDFIRALVELRKEQNLSQQDLADRLGISQATVAAFERHDNDPKLSTIRRYAHAVEALVAHAVAHDDGQLAAGDEWVTISFSPTTKPTTYEASSTQRTVSADRGSLALAA